MSVNIHFNIHFLLLESRHGTYAPLVSVVVNSALFNSSPHINQMLYQIFRSSLTPPWVWMLAHVTQV